MQFSMKRFCPSFVKFIPEYFISQCGCKWNLFTYGCGPYLKSLLNLLQYCFCLFFFCYEACGILVPRPGIEPTPPTLKGNVLTTGPPGESLTVLSTFAFKLWVKQDLRNYRLGEFSGINSRRKPLSQSPTLNPARTPLISNVAWNKLTFLGCKLTKRALENETVPGSSHWQS